MKAKLRKFTAFAQSLLPHETGWLLANNQLADPQKLAILQRLDEVSREVNPSPQFDPAIDKRKYSYILQWVTDRLAGIDVDIQYQRLNHLDARIATDSIRPDEERELSRLIREHDHTAYNFTKLYEVVQRYRQFLLIRMRYRQHREADDFLRRHRAHFELACDIQEKIHYATQDIVGQYAGTPAESIQWERWLTDVFQDEQLDGANRYMALVRLTFLYFNYRQFDRLRDKFDTYDALLREGRYYSHRLLVNYYNNRLLLHNYTGEYDKAIRYGYLSIRERNTDYIHYVNTLSGVLLKQKRASEALEVMRQAYRELKQVSSFHNRLTFVSFYLRALQANDLLTNAENYAESFLRAYSEEIFDHRWHLFFPIFFDILLQRDKTSRIVRLARKYRLLPREAEYLQSHDSWPYLRWQQSLAAFLDLRITRQQLEKQLADLPSETSDRGVLTFLDHLRRLAPEVMRSPSE